MGGKYLIHPLLPGQPCDHPRFDGAEIRYHELMAGGRDKRGPDQLGKRIRYVAVKDLHTVIILSLDEVAGIVEGLEIVARKVLHLYQTSGPSARSIGSIILRKSSYSVTLSLGRIHGHVFFNRGLPQLLADLQNPLDIFRINTVQKL